MVVPACISSAQNAPRYDILLSSYQLQYHPPPPPPPQEPLLHTRTIASSTVEPSINATLEKGQISQQSDSIATPLYKGQRLDPMISVSIIQRFCYIITYSSMNQRGAVKKNVLKLMYCQKLTIHMTLILSDVNNKYNFLLR